MLVVLMDNQLLATEQICPTCLLADQSGQPRWRQGELRCGRALRKADQEQPDQYECQMGFRIAQIN
ncbi:MAG: hypothetical protein ACKO7W_00565 [Elainella sp.]